VAGPSVSVKFGNPKGVANVAAQIRAQVIVRTAEGVIARVQERVQHPAAQTLTARGVNQWSASITGTRGGPGPIYPVKAQALRFSPKGGGVVFAKKVQGVGLGPLIEAECARVQTKDVDLTNIRIK
jgi:hypothetical protein